MSRTITINPYKRNGTQEVREHIRGGIDVVHEAHGKGKALASEYNSDAKFIWFFNMQRGLIKVGKRALKG